MAEFFVERLAAEMAAQGDELPPEWLVVLGKPTHALTPAEIAVYAHAIRPRRAELRAHLRRRYEQEGRPSEAWRAALDAAGIGPTRPIVAELLYGLWDDPTTAAAVASRRAARGRQPLWALVRAWGLILLVLGTVGGFALGGPAIGLGPLLLLAVFAIWGAILRAGR
jgi:hypothetical protein